MSDTLLVIHCYEGEADRIEAFLPLWKRHNLPLLFLSPADAPYTRASEDCRSAGARGWKGPQTVYRQIEHWKILQEYDYSYYVLFDADCACLSDALPMPIFEEPDAFWTTIIGHALGGGDVGYGVNYQPPYFVSRGTLDRLLAAAEEPEAERLARWKAGEEHVYPYDWGQCGAIDGLYVHAVQHARLNARRNPYGLHGLQYDVSLLEAAAYINRSGACVVHGIKTRHEFDFLQVQYRMWLADPDAFVGQVQLGGDYA